MNVDLVMAVLLAWPPIVAAVLPLPWPNWLPA